MSWLYGEILGDADDKKTHDMDQNGSKCKCQEIEMDLIFLGWVMITPFPTSLSHLPTPLYNLRSFTSVDE